MTLEAAPTGKRGRQPADGDAAIQTWLTMKVLSGMVDIAAPSVRATMSTRQTTGFVESPLRLVGLDRAVPDVSTFSRRQSEMGPWPQWVRASPSTLTVNVPYRGSDGPLHLLVDNTGIKVEGEGEWNARKHVGAKRRVRRKNHIGIDGKTLEIRAAEFTTSDVGDAPMLPELLDQMPTAQEIASGEPAKSNGAFDTRKDHDAIAAHCAAALGHSLGPVAFVPSLAPRKNA